MNRTVSRPRRLLACVGVLIATTVAMSGCANPIESLVNSASSSAADEILSEVTGVDVEGIGTAEIPADFPQSIPLPNKTPQTALSHTNDGVRSWILHFEEGVDDQVFEDLVAALVANGFAEETSSDMIGAMRIAVHTSSEYMVNASLLGAADEGQILQMVVTEN